jgi:hypothetical protein
MSRRAFGRYAKNESKTVRSGDGSIRTVRHDCRRGHEDDGVRLLSLPVLQVDTLGRPGGTEGYRAGRIPRFEDASNIVRGVWIRKTETHAGAVHA